MYTSLLAPSTENIYFQSYCNALNMRGLHFNGKGVTGFDRRRLYNVNGFDVSLFQIVKDHPIVLCASYLENHRNGSMYIAEYLHRAGFNAKTYKFVVGLL